LSNTGTWFIGRLQTERDKDRVLDGLEGVGSGAGGKFDRKRMEQILAGLGKRVFLMNNVNEDAPAIFETRWVMSYLRGPLTRNQIKQLMDQKKSAISQPTLQPSVEPMKAKKLVSQPASAKPVLPPEITQYFIPVQGEGSATASIFYEPMLLAIGKIYLSDSKAGITTDKDVSYLAPFSDHPSKINWDEAQEIDFKVEDIKKSPEVEGAFFGEFPKEAGTKQSYLSWSKAFNEWLYRNQKLELFESPSLTTVSEPGEAERDFRIRLQLVAHEKRDMLVERLRQKYASKIARLEERIRRAEQAVDREREQAQQQKLQTAISFGTTLLGAFMGRKKMSRSTLGRATTAARGAGRAMKEAKDVDRAEENLQVLQQQLSELQAQLSEEIEQT
ncbi:MAG: ATP-binding protein, partial [bacterium]